MNSNNHSRRAAAAPDAASGTAAAASMGVRPGAGVLGLAKAEAAARQAPADNSSEGTLIVGEGIQVKGEIQSCTRLIVEGKVEASLEARELTVRESGLYDGTAAVETAHIGGTFSGELTVKGLLILEAGGRVSGKLRYGELRIEQGGRLSGDVDQLEIESVAPRKADPQAAAKAAVSKAQAAAAEPRREGASAH